MLNKEQHKNTKIITTRGAEYGDNIHCIPVLADELRSLVLEFPVCLLKEPTTGQFALHALMGLEAGENLFLEGNQWLANYIPAHLARQPFMVAISGEEGDKPTPQNTMLTINMDSKRVQETEGEAIFNSDGSATDYLSGISNLLVKMVPSMLATEAFVAALAEHDLIEGIEINVTLAGGKKKNFSGLYTINEQKFAELSPETIQEFNNKGFLQACYLTIASMGNVQKLLKLKNKADS